MRSGSSSSAGAAYLDKGQRIEELRAAAMRARVRHVGIERVILFGSLVAGTPTPRSDADLLVVVRTNDAPPRDRVPVLLAAFSPLPCPLDLFVLTADEFARAQAEAQPLVREALAHGIDLL